MEAPDFIKNIDWELLKKQKLFLIETGIEGKTMDDILGLFDALQDYAVDEMGIDEKIVFNLSEDGEEPVRPKKTFQVCPHCGSKNVQRKAWVRPNENNKFVDYPEGDDDSDCWCDDCEDHGTLEDVEE